MSATCTICGAPSEVYLCTRHVRELKELLDGMPDWIKTLQEAAVGHTRLTTSGGRCSTRREPFRGDDDAIGGDVVAMRSQFLAAGGVNARASDELARTRNTLAGWVRHLLETRGATFLPPRMVETGFVGPLEPHWRRIPVNYSPTTRTLATWLASHVDAIAGDEAAGEFFADIEARRRGIERIVDRPESPRNIGPCPTCEPVKDKQGRETTTWLTAKTDDVAVTCPKCFRTHDIEHLLQSARNQAHNMAWSADKVIGLIFDLYGRELNDRTWRHWRKTNVVKAWRYQRADGRRIGINRHSEDDVPLFKIGDVLAAMNRKVKA